MAIVKCDAVVSSALFCCCISALEAILCLDDAAHCNTAGRLDVALSLLQVLHTQCADVFTDTSVHLKMTELDLRGSR